MALSILDGNQSATTLSTILSSGQHITGHTVVSLGTQAKTDILSAVSSGIAISGTVTASLVNVTGTDRGSQLEKAIAIGYNSTDNDQFQSVSDSYPLPIQAPNGIAISGTVTANFGGNSRMMGTVAPLGSATTGYVSIGVDGSPISSGAGRVVVDVVNQSGNSFLDNCLVNNNAIRAFGTVTIGAGTAQIGSVTASISGTVPVSISSVTVGNSVTIGSLPAISGTVTANTFALQGTSVTTSNFTSTTASTVLASFNATREVLTIFNEGAGNLHICAGATCTTIAYQVRLSAGDYYEVPNHQTSLTHSAVFATAGTARVCQVS